MWKALVAALAAGMTAAGAPDARAGDLLAYEGFEYAAGALGNGTGGRGWDGGWRGSCSLAGSASLLVSPPGELAPSAFPHTPQGGYARDVEQLGALRQGFRRLRTPLAMNTNTAYFVSFLLRRNSTGYPDTLDTDLLFYSGPDVIFDEEIRLGALAADTQFRLLTPTAQSWGGDLANDTVYFVVARIAAVATGTDELRLRCFGPADAVVEPQQLDEWDVWLPIAPHTWSTDALLDRVGVRGNAAYDFDELRIGTTWAAVTTGPLPVPGDFNVDGAVDAGDAAGLIDCLNGPALPPTPPLPTTVGECLEVFDTDRDGDVDLVDLADFAVRVGVTPP